MLGGSSFCDRDDKKYLLDAMNCRNLFCPELHWRGCGLEESVSTEVSAKRKDASALTPAVRDGRPPYLIQN
jgi:hypothetical protein